MEESHQRLRLVVHVAENGHSFQVDCQATTSIDLVQRSLASLSGVPSHDQLLICEDVRLEPQRSLASYKLPAEGRHVFLFNRVRLIADSPPPPVEWLGVKEPVMPSPPSASLCGHPLDHASDPALRALPSYERQFRYHFQKGHAFFSSSQDKFEACKRLHREQQVQRMALETAKGNMDHYYKIIDQMYQDFMKHFNRQHKQHADVLVNLTRDLERLRACRLHPDLISENRCTLVDCVNEASLRKRAEVCADSHKQFESKVLQLKSIYSELRRNVQDLLGTVPSVEIHSLERMITENAPIIEEEGSIMQSLSKDVDTVKKLVDDCVASQSSVSLRPHDAVSALGPMYDVHDKNHLPRIVTCYQKLGKLLEYFRAKKHEMSLCVHSCMQKVATLQSSIRDMRNQLSAFKEAMARQDEVFSELKVVRRVSPSYRACLSEVVRRKAGMKLYMGQAGQLAEKMARKRESEVARREEFFRVQSVFIPRDMLASMGLFGAPSQCVVNIEPYDTNLLDIDMKDVERYAPESIVGPLLKGASTKRCSHGNVSCEGSCSMEDSTVNMKCNDDIEALEDETNDEIAGTSKMEVENAWLKAELASAIALLCNLDIDFDKDFSDEGEGSKLRASVRLTAEKTAEALSLKDEHAKHLQHMLKASQLQCNSYEKRIHELEQRISDQYNELHMLSLNGANGRSRTSLKNGKSATVKSESSGITGEARMTNAAGTLEAMDDGVSGSPPEDVSQPWASDNNSRTNQSEKVQEGVAESMSDFASGLTAADAVVLNSQREEMHGLVAKEHPKYAICVEMQQAFNLMAAPMQDGASRSFDLVQEEGKGFPVNDTVAVPCKKDEQLKSLQKALLHKTNQCAVAEEKLKSALEDIVCLRTELEGNAVLLSECQMNCAHLENRLHEAREEARTNQCSADRKAAEYNALRTLSVKLRGLVERLRHCISASQAGTTGLAESLQALVIALNSDVGDDGTGDFRACVRLLAERVGLLAQQQSELHERCTLAEASQSHLAAELETKTELLKSQYAKHKIDKQAKICFTRFKVHELAVFLPNAAGRYEALNRNCPNYFLSDESVALFLANLPVEQQYIIGQIVHIDRNVARMPPQNSSISESGRESNTVTAGSRFLWNPYGLTVGTEYFVVTVAMIPDQMPAIVV